MENQAIQDFSDLAEQKKFKFKGDTFAVPMPTRKQMTELMRLSKQMVELSKQQDVAPDGVEAKPDEMDVDKTDKLFSLQQRYLQLGCGKVVEGKEELEPISDVDIEKWPIRVQNKVIELINQTLGMVNERADESPTLTSAESTSR